jgi:hypothetical protein
VSWCLSRPVRLRVRVRLGAMRVSALSTAPSPYEPGLFVVGDLLSERVKRAASAPGEVSSAVRAVRQHLAFIS